VKSRYFFNRDYGVLFCKGAACLDSGWEFLVAVSNDGEVFEFLPFGVLNKPYDSFAKGAS
jgi:hypothetical protein